MCRGVMRVLRPGGLFIQYSFAQPHFRAKYLKVGTLAYPKKLKGKKSISFGALEEGSYYVILSQTGSHKCTERLHPDVSESQGEHAREHGLEGSTASEYDWVYSATTIGE